jgi:pimeloyl-ACP methyl ester carboxylesterase
MLPKLLTPVADPALRAQVDRTMRAMPPEGMAQALEGMGERPDSRPTLAAIRVPTLIVVGEADAVTPPDAARAMEAAIPGARLVLVPGAAHLTTLEQPDAVGGPLVAWARSASAHGSR